MEVCFSSRIVHNRSGYDLSNKTAGQMNEHIGKSSANAQSLSRPAQSGGSITFKGIRSDKLLARIAGSKGFASALEFVDKKEAMFGAIVNLGLLTTIKPMLTLMMPAAEGKDKVSVASKEIVGGLVSFGLAWTITKPIEIGIIKITENPVKYVTNNEVLLKRLEDADFAKTFSTIYKNSPEIVNACLKGTLTVLFMPAVIAIMDKIRSKKTPPKKIKQEDLFISAKLGQAGIVSNSDTKGVS